jgi:CHAD domain-containing protein
VAASIHFDAVIEALRDEFELRAGRARTGTTIFYDTFDGRLYANGVTLRHTDGRLGLLDRATGEELASAPAPAERRLFAAELPEPLRARLADVIEMRALTRIARVRTTRRPVAVLNEDGKTVVRLMVEDSRVTPTGVRGYDSELERVRELLPAAVPLVDEAVAAAGGRPEGTSAKLTLELDPDEPATEAATTVFAGLLGVIAENLPGTLEDIDTEFLHDLRVSVRRTRSLQRQFKTVYPERLQHFRDEFKRIQQVTSDLRDLDVYLLDFDDLQESLPEGMRSDLDPLRTVLERHRAKALTATRRALKAQRTLDALHEWLEFVQEVPASEQTVRELASYRITRVYRKMVKLGRAIGDDSPAEDLHELRKVGKELRYLLEFFSSLYPPDVVKPFIKTLKGLQDQLGRFQDREVQANALRALAPEVNDPATVMAMGVLVDRFMKEETLARAEFADRFDAFASKAQRRAVKDTFG